MPRAFKNNDWSTVLPKLRELEVLTEQASQVAQATASEIRLQYTVVDISYEEGFGSDSDVDSESGSVSSDVTLGDVVEDLKTYTESLIDLSSSLEYPAIDVMLIEDLNKNLIEDFSNIPEPIRPFALIIRDRFPYTEASLVKKLGEANWHRVERLRQQRASVPPVTSRDSNSDDSSSIADTIRGPYRQSASASCTSIDFSITHKSTTTSSDFSEPSLFDHNSIAFQSRRYSTATESITSFATSDTDGPERGQPSIPKLPEHHDFEASFQCKICGEIVSNVRNRADWRSVSLVPPLTNSQLIAIGNMFTMTSSHTYVLS